MIQPSGSSSQWLSSVRVPIEAYKEARSLFAIEEYERSKEVLDVSMDCNIDSEFISGADVLILYAWNLFFLKKFKDFDRLFYQLSPEIISDIPEILLIHARRGMLGKDLLPALKICQEFVENNLDPISPLVAGFLFAKGMGEYKSGNSGQAIEDLEISFSIFQLIHNDLEAGRVGNYLGFVLLRMSNYEEALKWFSRTLGLFENLKLARKQSMVLLNSGIAYYKSGNLSGSLDTLTRSHQIGLDGNWPHRQLFTNIALGNVYRMRLEYKKARRHLHTAYTQAQELQHPREEALTLEFLGDVYRDENLFEDAERLYNRAMAIGKTIAPRGDIVMEVHRRLGECHLARLDIKPALEELEQALELARIQKDQYEEAVILRVRAEVWQYLGKLKEAQRTIAEAISILQQIGAKYELAVTLMTAAGFFLAEIEQGRPSVPVTVLLTRAWDKATQALDLFLGINVSLLTERCRRLVKKIQAMRDSQENAAGRIRTRSGMVDPQAYQPVNVIIHKSRKMREILQLCDMFAQSDEPALVVGETGTGKELLARRLHELSARAGGNLVTVNVSAIPKSLFEREFFGHVKGAFTGAEMDSQGLAARADGGTLFLDEIGDLSLEVQPKLLRLLQNGSYQALGDPAERRTDIRLVAATNADLSQMVQRGEFRSDLYYRLKILELELPPVRERQEDILLLLRHFLSEAAGRSVDLSDYFDRDSLDHMERFEWPGNVREIAMVARRANVELRAKGRVDLFLTRPGGGKIRISSSARSTEHFEEDKGKLASDAVERTRILMALEESGGSRSEAARQLGMSRSTLYRRMIRLGLTG